MSNDQNQPGKPKWKHTIGCSTSAGMLNRETGRAAVERLEHIAALLERIATQQENATNRKRYTG